MSNEARRTMQENRRLHEELKFLQSFISDLQEEKAALERNYGTAKRDVGILSDQELEYAKQAHYKTAEIKALRERVEHLEKQQIITGTHSLTYLFTHLLTHSPTHSLTYSQLRSLPPKQKNYKLL